MNKLIDEELNISIITKIEVLGFNGNEPEMKRLEDFLALSAIIYIDEAVANQTIALQKTQKIKLTDVIIAATATINNLVLLSRNTKDFGGISGFGSSQSSCTLNDGFKISETSFCNLPLRFLW